MNNEIYLGSFGAHKHNITCHVMLSRPRALASLKSVGLTDKVREVIEQGPPEELVSTFQKLFREKIEDTKALAVQAAKHYNLLPGLI